jgi:hypothetical protein
MKPLEKLGQLLTIKTPLRVIQGEKALGDFAVQKIKSGITGK